MQPSVAIIILNYNGQGHLENYLPSVLSATYAQKSIWVVDNNSTDGSCALIEQLFPTVNVLAVPNNKGFVGGYNYALENIHADYIVLLNNDVRVGPGFIEPAIAMLEADKTIAALQSKMRSINQPEYFDYAGAAGGYIDSLGYPFCRGRVLETVEVDNEQYNNNSTELFWATGGCLFVRHEHYRAINGMYTYLFMQNEDIDLCWRLQLKGYKIGYCAQSVVFHLGGGSLSWEHPRKVFFTFRNNLIVLSRNMPLMRLLWVMPLRFCLDSMAACRYILIGKAGHGFAIWKATLAYLRWLFFVSRFTAKGENKWTGKRGIKQCNGYISGSVLWNYFVRHKTTFTAIVDQKQ
ncbi:MAG TPA: glycosyltransferase family 2 protein [Phnomibacter sp.]|nr:glycosyltransferase family 2 protein [Phnomibacter sp.]